MVDKTLEDVVQSALEQACSPPAVLQHYYRFDISLIKIPAKAYNIMASGRPIVYFGSADGEIGRLVREERIGYIGWPPCWDLAELQEMGRRARSLAETRYSKAAMLEKFMEALG